MPVLNASFLASLLFDIILGMDTLDLIDLDALLEHRKFKFYFPVIWYLRAVNFVLVLYVST